MRLLVLTGGHPHPASFYSLFDESEGYRALIDPAGEILRSPLHKFDALVVYTMAQEIDSQSREHLREFLRRRGMLVVHHGLASYSGWEWWWREALGCRYRLRGEAASAFTLDVTYRAQPVCEHFITEGIAEFELTDETYCGMWIAPGAQVLVRTAHENSDGPLAWVSPYPDAGVVCLQPGHSRLTHRNPAYRRIVINALHWIAAQ